LVLDIYPSLSLILRYIHCLAFQGAGSDRYGRIPGRVYTEDGMEVNRWLVQHGAAWVYPDFNTDYTLPVYQREARTMKRGLWADKKPVPPWLWRKENKNDNKQCINIEYIY
ncbi:thermonuclease family protein, partial [Escherichia coli]